MSLVHANNLPGSNRDPLASHCTTLWQGVAAQSSVAYATANALATPVSIC